MKVIANQLYHIYNQGNNREKIFLDKEDYLLFLKMYRQYVLPVADAICYCLMPNHFHFLINTTKKSVEEVVLGNIKSCKLANAFRLLCSSYANKYNKKYERSGSLFRQKTQAKNLEENQYAFICFQYIHQNPIKANLCDKMEEWEYSSFRDYAGFRNGTLCKYELAYSLIDISKNDFYNQSCTVISEKYLSNIFNS